MRTERDSIGTREVPADAYYGINSVRSAENFQITGQKLHPGFVRCLGEIKKAAAITNRDTGELPAEKAAAIISACDEIIAGGLLDSFIVDPIEGGAGTSMNMNANEVIANRAIELLGGTKGDYSLIHPNDHVNLSQSTNDVIPTAIKMTAIRLCDALEDELRKLFISLLDKSTEFADVIKIGRTQMQDAVPITLGQEFFAYADAVRRSTENIEAAKRGLAVVNMGGTAIGTGINASVSYREAIVPKLKELSGLELTAADNLIDATQHADCFVLVSGALKACAAALSKIASDLRLMSSGPNAGFNEILLPQMQSGSSIMPGKVNPVIPEVVNQAAFRVIGNDVCITMAAEAGQLELNAFEPVIAYSLFESLRILTAALVTFRENCIVGIRANGSGCLEGLNRSTGTVTALCPHIGYDKAVWVAKRVLKEKRSAKEIVMEEGLLSAAELDEILDPKTLV